MWSVKNCHVNVLFVGIVWSRKKLRNVIFVRLLNESLTNHFKTPVDNIYLLCSFISEVQGMVLEFIIEGLIFFCMTPLKLIKHE
jgi:hypothetical protein